MYKINTKNTKMIIFLLMCMNTLAAMSIDIYLPSLPIIMDYFSTTYSKVELTISLFMLGFGISQIVYGPLLDRYGRRRIIFSGLAIYITSTIMCGFSSSINLLIVCRMIQAIGACGVTVTTFAIVRDLFEGKQCTKILSYLTISMGCIPVFAPILGSYLEYWFGWKSNFVFLTLFGLTLMVMTFYKLPETNRFSDRFAIQPKNIIANYKLIISHSQYRIFVLCSIFSFVPLFSFIANSPYYIIELGKTSSQYFSFLFAANAISLILGGMLSARLSNKINQRPVISIGATVVLLGSILMIAQMVARPNSIVLFVVSMAVCTFGTALIMPAAMAGALSSFPKKAGSVAALTGCLRFLMASFVAYMLSYLQLESLFSLPLIISGCATIILIAISKNILPPVTIRGLTDET